MMPRDRETPGCPSPETGRRPDAPAPPSSADARSAEELEQERAFYEYVELARKAQSTMDLMDAIAAGKAWSRFVYLFCGEQPT